MSRNFFKFFCVSYFFVFVLTIVLEYVLGRESFAIWFYSQLRMRGYSLPLFLSFFATIGLLLYFGIRLKNFLSLLILGFFGFIVSFLIATDASPIPAIMIFFSEIINLIASTNLFIGFIVLFPFSLSAIYGLFILFESYSNILVKKWVVVVFATLLAIFLSLIENLHSFQRIFVHSQYPHVYGFVLHDGLYAVGPTFGFVAAVLGVFLCRVKLLAFRNRIGEVK